MYEPATFYHRISEVSIGKTKINKGIYYSDHPHYQDILHLFIQEYPFVKNAKKCLIIAHEDNTADILANEEFSIVMRGQPKRQNKSKGDMIAFHKELRNFHSISFIPDQKDKIPLSNEDTFIGYISLTNFLIDINGVIFFDLSGENAWESIENYFLDIPQKIQNRIFKKAYELCRIYTQYDDIYEQKSKSEEDNHRLASLAGRLDTLRGWFPFQRILGEEFENLYNDINKSLNENLNLPHLQIINAFDNHRLNEMLSDWSEVEVLPHKQLETGLKHYQNQDPFSSIHVLIPYIEGIVRKTLNNGLESIDQPTIREKISEDLKGILHTTEDNTLYIKAFKSYLKHIWHSSFSNSYNELLSPINRNTVSHGINMYEEFTMEKALQLILTIDQLSYIYETT